MRLFKLFSVLTGQHGVSHNVRFPKLRPMHSPSGLKPVDLRSDTGNTSIEVALVVDIQKRSKANRKVLGWGMGINS